MEHVKHFTEFVFESNMINESNDYSWSWNEKESEINWVNSKNVFAKNYIKCKDGNIVSGHDGMGRSYEFALGIKCDDNAFNSKHEAIIAELNKIGADNVHGIFWKPIDKNAKALAVKAIKDALK